MKTIGDLIEYNARHFGTREAFVCEGQRLTHAQFADRARRIAAALYGAGMRRGDRIAILSKNCQETWDVFGAAEVAGFVAVPLNFRLAAAEVEYLLSDCQPSAIVFEPDLLPLVAAYRASHPDLVWLELGGGAIADWAAAFEDFARSGAADGPPIRSAPDDLVYLLYTSGTTGRPKGAMLVQGRALGGAETGASETEMQKFGTWLVHSPQFHVGANGPRLSQQFRAGKVVLHRSFDPARALRDMQDERINGTMTVGTMLQAVLDLPDAETFDLTSMNAWMIGGAPCAPELIRRAIDRLGRIFVLQYGMTEGRVAAMFRDEVDPDTAIGVKRLRSVGRQPLSSDLRILGDDGKSCPPNVPGEVVFRSPNMFVGYWNNSAATTEALRDGWMHTGDIGYIDEDNFLYLVDRKKDMIISGGENIYSREVEDALHKHPDVVEAAVVGVPDEKWGEAVKAFVILAAGANSTEQAMIDHCRGLIARYKCPKYVEFAVDVPRIASGKVNKVELRKLTTS